MLTHRCLPKEDPTAIAEELIRQGFEIDHIEGDVITYEKAAPAPAALAHAARGLNTDDFSQKPTIDADRSADWNRKAKNREAGQLRSASHGGED